MANMIKGKTPEEIRKLFNIVNDFTPEEEVRRIAYIQLSWAFAECCFQPHRHRSRRRMSGLRTGKAVTRLPVVPCNGLVSSHSELACCMCAV